MIIKTNKKDALELVKCATRRLQNETFLQCNMVGIDWLFVIASEGEHIQLTTDLQRNQLEIRVYNKHSELSTNDWYNVTRSTMQAIREYMASIQNKYVYGLIA